MIPFTEAFSEKRKKKREKIIVATEIKCGVRGTRCEIRGARCETFNI